MWTIGSSSVAPVVHGWGTGPLYSSYFWMRKILAPVERSRLGVTIRTRHTTYIHFCMCVQEKLNVRMEVQSKKFKKFLNTFMWLHREIFISHSPVTSDEFNWRNPIWWLKTVDLEKMKLAVTRRKVGWRATCWYDTVPWCSFTCESWQSHV